MIGPQNDRACPRCGAAVGLQCPACEFLDGDPWEELAKAEKTLAMHRDALQECGRMIEVYRQALQQIRSDSDRYYSAEHFGRLASKALRA